MQSNKTKKIVRRYMQELRKNNFPFSAVYLFGSTVRHEAGPWSDIDVAVVSNEFSDRKRLFLRQVRRQIDTRIEPHGFTVREFADNANPLAYEIRKTGERVV